MSSLWQRLRAAWRRSWLRDERREDSLAADSFLRERERHERDRGRDPSVEPFDMKNPVP